MGPYKKHSFYSIGRLQRPVEFFFFFAIVSKFIIARVFRRVGGKGVKTKEVVGYRVVSLAAREVVKLRQRSAKAAVFSRVCFLHACPRSHDLVGQLVKKKMVTFNQTKSDTALFPHAD